MVILYTADHGKFISLKNITLEEMDAKNIKKNGTYIIPTIVYATSLKVIFM